MFIVQSLEYKIIEIKMSHLSNGSDHKKPCHFIGLCGIGQNCFFLLSRSGDLNGEKEMLTNFFLNIKKIFVCGDSQALFYRHKIKRKLIC